MVSAGVQSSGGSDAFSGLWHPEVQTALHHPLYDVRAATLKALLAQSAGQHALQGFTAKHSFRRVHI